MAALEPHTAQSAEETGLRTAGQRVETGLRTAGQRRVNLLWETTQGVIAVSVTLTVLFVCARMILSEKGSEGAFLLLSNVFFLIVGTYFQRTNHTKTGGVSAEWER